MHRSILVCCLIASFLSVCESDANSFDNLDDSQIEFYQNVNKKVLTTTPKPNSRFSIFQKRTRPLYRKNNKFQTSTNYKIINDQPFSQQSNQVLKLNRTKSTSEFVDVYETNRPISNRLDSNDDTVEPTIAQQTIFAWQHGLKIKQQAKCDKPKPTVVYLNQDKEQIKVYLPRATILHRCGQNTGCCESESEQCVAIEQKQVNLYFFVIKLEREFADLDNSEDQTSSRKGRKFAILDQNDDKLIKEYEYNLDYTIDNNDFKLNDNYDLDLINRLKKEKNYLNSLLNQDDLLKRRLTRSIRKDSTDTLNDKFRSINANSKRNLSGNDFNAGESLANNSTDFIKEYQTPIASQSRINSKKPFNFASTKQSNGLGTYRNHIRRSLGGQLRPKQTIEVLTFTNHTRCGCVIRN